MNLTLAQVLEHLRFLKGRPRVLSKIFMNTFMSMILKRFRLRNMQLAVTYACNFKCPMCSSTTLFEHDKKILTLEQIKNILDEARELGLVHLDITGGEPLLRGEEELCEIIRYATCQKDIIVSIATNGFLTTKNNLKKFKDAGLHTVLFNLQSSDESRHDAIMDVKGSFRKVLDGITYAKEMGLGVCINTVLSADNFEEIEELRNFCENKKILLLINPAASSGRWRYDEEKKISNLYPRYIKLLKKPYSRADTVYNFRTAGSGCPGGIEKIYVTAHGEVLQCTFVQVSYGNATKEPLRDIYARMCNFPITRKYKDRCKHLFDQEFQEKWLYPIRDQKALPLPVSEHPAVKGDEKLQKALKS